MSTPENRDDGSDTPTPGSGRATDTDPVTSSTRTELPSPRKAGDSADEQTPSDQEQVPWSEAPDEARSSTDSGRRPDVSAATSTGERAGPASGETPNQSRSKAAEDPRTLQSGGSPEYHDAYRPDLTSHEPTPDEPAPDEPAPGEPGQEKPESADSATSREAPTRDKAPLSGAEARSRLDTYIAGLQERLAALKDKAGEPVRITDLQAKRSTTDSDMYEIYGRLHHWEVVPGGIGSPGREVDRADLVRIGGFVPETGETLTSRQIDSRDGVAVAENGPVEYLLDAIAIAGIVRSVGSAVVNGLAARAERAAAAEAAELAPRLGAPSAAATAGSAAEGRLAGSLAPSAEASVTARPTASATGADVVTMSERDYLEARWRNFPADQLDPVARFVDDIGQQAALKAIENPKFVAAVARGDLTAAGTQFHSEAAKIVNALPEGALPGWELRAELTIQGGKGGSRADVLAQGPGGVLREFDWKTTGRSGLDSIGQMEKHADQIGTQITPLRGGTLSGQESRSWVDYVKPLMPQAPWK